MQILNIHNEQIEQDIRELFADQLVDVKLGANMRDAIVNAKQFLDNKFPLARGSHQDVSSYVVYHQQLLIFFKDGSNTGLKKSSQFVALNGHKSDPSAILLQDGGIHVELSFDRGGSTGAKDCGHIEDIRLEGHEYWVSLLTLLQCKIDCSSDSGFTAKDGSDYQLKVTS